MPLASTGDLAQLEQHIDPEYSPKAVAKKLADGLSNAVKAILIERNYIDKDYRSTYYNFYAKKGRRYRADCVRLHFFDGTVSFDEKTLRLAAQNDPRLTDHYYGFMVLRPTGIATIGRSVLTPDVRRGASRFIITADHKVHLLGYKLTIRGFPSMDQHVDISVCARDMLVDSSTLQRTLQHLPRVPYARHHDDGAALRSRWSRSVQRTSAFTRRASVSGSRHVSRHRGAGH